ncbi:hypothetical protein KXR53_01440 [Inquilinus limosus]|uniref:hypothetical protein n=1 Tax=Inquilinus limosus TaxID=171674 RepID=UPI003F168FB7
MKRFSAAAIAALSLSGCASITEGTSQEIRVDVTPAVASCSGTRKGAPTGTYDPVSHIYKVDKSRNDILFTCKAPGYRDKTVTLVSSASGWGVAGALTLDFGLVDYATGALNKYEPTLTVTLEPQAGPTLVAAPAVARQIEPSKPAAASGAVICRIGTLTLAKPAQACAEAGGVAVAPVD